jgi:hypothetical protein
MSASTPARVALLWRGSREARIQATPEGNRLTPTFDALAAVGLAVEPAVYGDRMVDEVRAQLLGLDGVLVWVDPITEGRDRSQLDLLLREVAAAGVWVSAHPDVIMKMGTKQVLHRTQSLGWGSDTKLYRSLDELRAELPRELARGGARVLKQYRGNGGNGVWKVELEGGAQASGEPPMEAVVRILHALRGSEVERVSLGAFVERCAPYFADGAPMIDQVFQSRLPEGMIRCYMVQASVVGYGQQLIKALVPPPPEGPSSAAAQPGPRIMHGADAPAFQRLRRALEGEWIPGMQRLLGLDAAALPAIWDADFLYGPKTPDGEDSYVLCEINVSAVLPFPEDALAPLAHAVRSAVLAARGARAANA